MRKLVRLATMDYSLGNLLKGQLKYLSAYHEVIGVASNSGKLQGIGDREGIRVADIPMSREISLKQDVRSLLALFRFLRQERPYILHCNTPKGSLLGLAAGWLARVPHRIYTVTGLRYQGAHGLLRLILKTMERLSCLFATKVIPEGQGVLHTLQHDHITRKPLVVLHHGNINGIDTAFFSRKALSGGTEQVSRTSLGLADDDFVFVFIGRIVHDKGMDELARAFARLSACQLPRRPKLLIVGSFEKGDPIDRQSEQEFRTSPDVCLAGWQSDVRPYLAISDALVFPSYREGFPNVPIQAGAMDVASIVTNINGCNEIIKDGQNGKIIAAPLAEGSEQMEAALYDTMRWFVEHPAEVGRMARNARAMITSRYEQRDVWEATLQMYQSL